MDAYFPLITSTGPWTTGPSLAVDFVLAAISRNF